MRRIAIVVEGQTEERFISDVLQPQVIEDEIYLQPIIAPTKVTPTGTHKGGEPWREYRKLARNLNPQRQFDAIGVLLDFYGAPQDTPGYEEYRDTKKMASGCPITTASPSPLITI